jgi:hypothetical protein
MARHPVAKQRGALHNGIKAGDLMRLTEILISLIQVTLGIFQMAAAWAHYQTVGKSMFDQTAQAGFQQLRFKMVKVEIK